VKIVVLTPHFAPDTAPTGTVVTRIVTELAARGHELEVITALPWYRDHKIEEGFEGKLVRTEDTPWGRILRLHPFPTEDKRNIPKRALAFTGFSALAAAVGRKGEKADIVLAVSPPLTLGVDGWLIARARGAKFVFNIQDVYPDVAVELGVLTNPALIRSARKLERFCYERSAAVTVLSDDLRNNLAAKISDPSKIHVIPNFVDTDAIRPAERENGYRQDFGLSGKRVVMYAGNVGLSQSLDMVITAARKLAHHDDLAFVINGQGAARTDLESAASGLANVHFIDQQPIERLPELLAAADLHLVPLKKGLASSSVPSKTYSILAAGRPVIASVDPGTEIARLVENSGAGVAVGAEDESAFIAALERLLSDPQEMQSMGSAGRAFVETWASPAAVAEAYEKLFESLIARS
jgi:colanic acid biosynthesis glycosyl transferase WcaI